MVGNLKNKNENVICCFCGKPFSLKEAVVLSVQINIESEEIQYLFCHKKHLTEKIDKSIILHSDLADIERDGY
jgi:hypothetical protein